MKNLGIIFLILFAGGILLASCNKKKSVQAKEVTGKEEVAEESVQSSAIRSVEVDRTHMHKSTDSFTLLESNVKGDILSLIVQYSGGCETHEWRLVTNGAYSKSLPPQVTLSLEHNANGDMCRALLSDTLEFNIEEIKYPGSFNLVVKIRDYEKQEIMYNYR